MENFFDSVLRALKKAVEDAGSIRKLADLSGVNSVTLSRWISGERNPSVVEVSKVFDTIGLTFNWGALDTPSKDVCFVDAKIAPAGEELPPPPDEDYLAVPLVEEVGAGPGIIPQNELISWFLVWRHQRAIQHKRDLIAVMLGKHSTSMVPTLKPQDIVLVDRQDKDVMNFKGSIMLVLDPCDGSGKIKRVAAENQPKKKDYRITYYSDNAAENPPEVYSLMEDFEGDWNKSIVGRVVWAWSDVSCK